MRFAKPVKVDSRVRGHFKPLRLEPLEGGAQVTVLATIEIEIEAAARPACVAETASRRYT